VSSHQPTCIYKFSNNLPPNHSYNEAAFHEAQRDACANWSVLLDGITAGPSLPSISTMVRSLVVLLTVRSVRPDLLFLSIESRQASGINKYCQHQLRCQTPVSIAKISHGISSNSHFLLQKTTALEPLYQLHECRFKFSKSDVVGLRIWRSKMLLLDSITFFIIVRWK